MFLQLDGWAPVGWVGWSFPVWFKPRVWITYAMTHLCEVWHWWEVVGVFGGKMVVWCGWETLGNT